MKRFLAVILVIVLLFSILCQFSSFAFGDPMSLTTISGLAYAIGQSSGLVFNFTDGTAAGAQNNMESAINSWLAGRSVAEAFGVTPAQIIAGKLIVPMTLFNGIKNFLEDFIDDMGIGTSSKEIWKGSIGGVPIGEDITENALTASGISCTYRDVPDKNNGRVYAHWYVNGVSDAYENALRGYNNYGISWCVQNVTKSRPGYFRITYRLNLNAGDPLIATGEEHELGITDKVEMSLPSGFDETVLNPDQEWSGTIGGQDWPDDNLDQMIGTIFDDISNDTLDIEGEIVDPVVPPTPVPTRQPVEDILEGVNVQITQLDELEESLKQLGVYSGMIQSAVEQTRQAILDQSEWKDAELSHLLTLINIESQSDARLRDIYEDFKISLASIDDQTADVIGALGDIKEGLNEQTSDILPTLTDIKDQQAEQTSDIVGALEGIQNKQDEQTGDIVGGLDDIREGLNEQTGDIVGGLDDIREGLNEQTGDIVGGLDGIREGLNEQTGDIVGGLDGIKEGLNEQTGVISGAIDQAISDSIAAQQEAVKDQTADITAAQEATTEAVSDLTGVVSEALTAPEIDEKTFDLRELFPFCIPFDIYHLLQKFDGSPSAPHVQLPIVIPSIGFSYTMDLDFSAWDPVAAAMRTVELIVFALGLAWATSKVIKW